MGIDHRFRKPSREEKPVIKAGEPYELIARSTALLRELTD